MKKTLACFAAVLLTSAATARAEGSDGVDAVGADTADMDDMADADAHNPPSAGAGGHAQPNDDSWRDKASPEEQERARALFQEGNALVKESLFVQATEKYEAALQLWDHPAIHYNLALALLNLDQPVRLRAHLLGSLKYGSASLGEDKAKRAEQYLKLVEKQLTQVTIKSEHEGARIEFDGELLFVAPGEYTDFVEPGQHTIRATHEGFEATERPVQLIPGEDFSMDMKLYTPEDWIRYRRRWDSQLGPVLVTAVGGAALATGAILLWQGSEKIKQFDEDVAGCGPDGCAPGEIDSSAELGDNLQIAGVATLAVGGAAALTGGVLLFMNRRVAYRVDPGAEELGGDEAPPPQVSFAPALAPGYAGIFARGTF